MQLLSHYRTRSRVALLELRGRLWLISRPISRSLSALFSPSRLSLYSLVFSSTDDRKATKWLTPIVFAFVLAILPSAVSADTIYEQLFDSTGEVAPNHTGTGKVAEFTLSASSTITADAYGLAFVKSVALGFAGPVTLDIQLGTTCSGTLVSFSASLPAADGLFHELNFPLASGLGVELGPGVYSVCSDNTSIFNTTVMRADILDTNFYGFIQNGGTSPFLSDTRIVSTVPYAQQVVPTSTAATLGTSVFINAEDWTNSNFDWFVRIRLTTGSQVTTQPNGVVTLPPNLAQRTYDFPITTSGGHFFSTTTDLSYNGRYTVVTSIRRPTTIGNILGFFGFGSDYGVVVSTTTSFVASTTNARDDIFEDLAESALDYLDNASSTLSISDCGSLFNIGQCLLYFVQPNPQSISQFSGLGDDLSRKPPFGYWTAIKDILATSTASTTPNITMFGAATVVTWLAVLIAGIANIILLMVAIYIFQRIAHLDW